jgi:23S rRNA-/tRNA-specific pseudouridylate synthase
VSDLTFLYEDTDIFAVYKPSGVHSVKLPEEGGHSLADDLLEYDPELAKASRSALDGGLVQRLDFGTSGVLLGAKNRAMWGALYEALSAGEIRKSYVALVEGEQSETATVSTFIGSPYRGAKKMRIYSRPPTPPVRALPGTTVFTPIRYLKPFDITVIKAEASPARRHQVRAHAAYIKHPLIGDLLYGAKRSVGALCATPRDFFLHAWRLSLSHPRTGVPLEIESDFEVELSDRASNCQTPR